MTLSYTSSMASRLGLRLLNTRHLLRTGFVRQPVRRFGTFKEHITIENLKKHPKVVGCVIGSVGLLAGYGIYDSKYRKEFKTHYYDYTQVKNTSNYKGKKKDGIETEFYITGEKRVETPYVKGVRCGEEKHYDRSGNIIMLVSYENDMKHGKEIHYFKNGSPEYVISYVHGEKHGVELIYSKTCDLIKKNKYEHGKLIIDSKKKKN